MAQGPVEPGECVITAAGIGCRRGHVIHAAVMGQDLRTSATDHRCARPASALAMAERARARVGRASRRSAPASADSRSASARGIMIDGDRRRTRPRALALRLVRLVLFGRASPTDAFADRRGRAPRVARCDGPADCPLSG